jgi:hypothetical protein
MGIRVTVYSKTNSIEVLGINALVFDVKNRVRLPLSRWSLGGVLTCDVVGSRTPKQCSPAEFENIPKFA